ncbi:hypothetical protein JOB18_021277 [Solea senegalensis]|nr:uncharacterized protein LOC122775202 [Solea senegalensis]KAG7474978.1 hypothetical protein JOB18_021277 [Solea senegalensis]
MEHIKPILEEWRVKLPRILSLVNGNQCFFGVDETYVCYNMNAIPSFFARFLGTSPLIPCCSLMEYELLVTKEVTTRVNNCIAKEMTSNTKHLRFKPYDCNCIAYETLREMTGHFCKAMRCLLLRACHCTRAQQKRAEESSTGALRKAKKTHIRTISKEKSIVIYSTSEKALMDIMSEVVYIHNMPDHKNNPKNEGGRCVDLLIGDGLHTIFENDEEQADDTAHLSSSYDEDGEDADFGAFSNELIASFGGEDVGQDAEYSASSVIPASSGVEDVGEVASHEGENSEPPTSSGVEDVEEDVEYSEIPPSSGVEDVGEDADYSEIPAFSGVEDVAEHAEYSEMPVSSGVERDGERADGSEYSEQLASCVTEEGEDGGRSECSELPASCGTRDVGGDAEHSEMPASCSVGHEGEDANGSKFSKLPASCGEKDIGEPTEYVHDTAHRKLSSTVENIADEVDDNVDRQILFAETTDIRPGGDLNKQLLRNEVSFYSPDPHRSTSARVSGDYIKYYTRLVNIVTRILMHTIERAHVSMPQTDFNRIVHNVSYKLLAQLELRNISVRVKKVANIKAVVCDLSKTFHSAQGLLKELEGADDTFIEALRRKLTEKNKSIFGCFLSVGKDFYQAVARLRNGTSCKRTRKNEIAITCSQNPPVGAVSKWQPKI